MTWGSNPGPDAPDRNIAVRVAFAVYLIFAILAVIGSIK